MAEYTRREWTRTTIQYELPTPSNAAELNKMFTAAEQNFEAVNGRPVRFDDDMSVSTMDDLVVISFVKPEPR